MKKYFDYFIYVLAILLAFFLVFEPFLVFPKVVNWLGHWHPVILHFPIVLILVTIVQYWRKDAYFSWYLSVTTILTLLSAMTGFILSLENGNKGNFLLVHQWMGIAVSFIMVSWYFFDNSISGGQLKILHVLLIILIVGTGHFGGMVTHGQDFLTFGTTEKETVGTLPMDPNVYHDIVQSVLDKKCVSCHNSNKSKGELVLTEYSSIRKGGKSGSVFDAQHGILHRINLPLNHEKHMPPQDEKQLEETELTILKSWLELGGPDSLRYSELDLESELHQIIEQLIDQNKENKWLGLPELSDQKIQDYSSDYCTIRRVFGGSNALQVLIFPHESFSTEELENLNSISEHIIDLNLSKLPITSEHLGIINKFINLELLDLSGSLIDHEDLMLLSNLTKLRSLKIYETQIGREASDVFALFPVLADLYLYNTSFSNLELEQLKETYPALNVIGRSVLADEFKSVLPVPSLEPRRIFYNEPFYLKLNHPLKEINIRYTTDASIPDENSNIFKDSLLVRSNQLLKFYASKDGWEPSLMDSVQFIRSMIVPDSFHLLHPPDQKYLGIGKSLLFDLQKGSRNFGDDAWMAYKDQSFVLNCEFDEKVTISGVVLSSMINTDPYIFPPSSIRVYGGKNQNMLRLLGSLTPHEPRERIGQHFEYYKMNHDPIECNFYKIEVIPLRKIPMWHQGKGETGWFFIDEVVIIVENMA